MVRAFFLSVLMLLSALANAQLIQYPSTQAAPEYPATARIQPSPLAPGEEIQIALWSDKYHYYTNEEVEICFRVSHDSYLFLYSTDARGQTRQIFPNAYDRNNFLQSDVTYCIPDRNYRLVATGPAGRETLYAVATNYPYDWLGDPLRLSGAPFPSVKDKPEDIYMRVQQESKKASEARTQAESTGTDKPQAVPLRTPRPEDVNERIAIYPAHGRAWQTFWIHSGTAYRPPDYRQPYRSPRYEEPYYPTPTPTSPRYQDYDDEWRRDPYRPPYYIPNIPPDNYFPQDGPQGTLKISSAPDRADVFIDGVYFGRTPFEREMPAGRYDVMVRKQGYRSWERTVRLSANATEVFTFRLTPE